jgi:hypothetical protein
MPLASSELLTNPGLTKLALVSFGVALPDGLDKPSQWISQTNAGETVIDMVLPSGHWTTVPVGQPYTESSPISLVRERDRYFIECGGKRLPVQMQQVPRFYRQLTKRGARMGAFSALHDKVLILHPFLGCGFFAVEGQSCRYCLYDSMLNERVPPMRDPLELVEVLHAAQSEREVDTVYLYNGYSPDSGCGLYRLLPVVELLRRHLPGKQIALETVAPQDVQVVDELYGAGIDVFICNLELYDPDSFARLCPGKEEHGGQTAVRQTLERAVQTFPAGAVVSNLIVGLEPVESTMAGVEDLVSSGVVPLLQPFRPLPGTPLEDVSRPSLQQLETVFLHLYETLQYAKIPLRRLRNMGRVMTPVEGRFMLGREASLRERLGDLALSTVGRRVGSMLDNWRRNLRVHYADDTSRSSR